MCICFVSFAGLDIGLSKTAQRQWRRLLWQYQTGRRGGQEIPVVELGVSSPDIPRRTKDRMSDDGRSQSELEQAGPPSPWPRCCRAAPRPSTSRSVHRSERQSDDKWRTAWNSSVSNRRHGQHVRVVYSGHMAGLVLLSTWADDFDGRWLQVITSRDDVQYWTR